MIGTGHELTPYQVLAWLRGDTPNHQDVDLAAMTTSLPDEDCPRCGRRGQVIAVIRAAEDGLGGVIRCQSCSHSEWYLYRPTLAAEPAMPEDLA